MFYGVHKHDLTVDTGSRFNPCYWRVFETKRTALNYKQTRIKQEINDLESKLAYLKKQLLDVGQEIADEHQNQT